MRKEIIRTLKKSNLRILKPGYFLKEVDFIQELLEECSKETGKEPASILIRAELRQRQYPNAYLSQCINEEAYGSILGKPPTVKRKRLR
jgi:hypothetical protein